MSVSSGVAATAEPAKGRLTQAARPITEDLVQRAESDRLASTFVDYTNDRQGERHTLTWRQLVARVRDVAAAVTEQTAPGDRVAVLAPQNHDYVTGFLGALLAGRIAVPLFAPELGAHADRLVGALANCAPKLWLTSSSSLDAVEELATTEGVPAPGHILAVDGISEGSGKDFKAPEIGLDEPAYLQYTSGSTRTPAGAVITHRAVATNCAQGAAGFPADETSTCVGWLPLFHDMGLVLQICFPVHLGAHAVFTTPFAFILKPVRWLELLAEFPNAVTGGPNFAFDMLVKKTTEEDRARLDLSRVHSMRNGAEPIRAGTIDRFAEAFGPCGLDRSAHRPSYGLAEATVYVTTTGSEGPVVRGFDRAALADNRAVESTAEDALPLVAAGTPAGQLVRIVDRGTGEVVPDGTVGEIWVYGANVASAYWDSPEATETTFRGVLHEEGLPEGPWLRTGDLGMFHADLLFITGRMKDLIIIDGKNHYPQDIEATAEQAHEVIRRQHLAAFSVDDGETEGAVVLIEARPGTDLAAVDQKEFSRSVKRAVSQVHDVKLRDVRLIPTGGIIRTSSGKIARAANREQYLDMIRTEK
ncbi:fatty acyl-AMP ligase [Sciscionella sediminilitoris]|uniref:fatty acyl-AMP ligase n=1 Tax=Sciscionella sediminilitoris TaxID=1445613 RepID=UPI0004DF680F|nr:fatty acyl-AMP ligase [Sciscionella sp. SE31]